MYVTGDGSAYVRVMDLSLLLRRWWLLPLVLVVTAGSIGTNLGQPLPIALGILSALTLFVVERAPGAVVVNGLVAGSYFAAGGDNGPVFFTIPVAALLASLAYDVRRVVLSVAASGVLVWAGLLLRGLRESEVDISFWQSFGVGALIAAAVAVGTSARTRRAAQADRQQRAVSEERLRMAQDLHDGVGHGLAVIAMQAGAALHVLDRDPARARASLEAIRATSKESLEALRSQLAVMSTGAPRRPGAGLADLPALFDRVRATGLRLDAAEVTPLVREVAPAVGEVAYFVAQEALTNVLRHSGATAAVVEWERRDDRLVLTVRDDGRGGAVQDEGMGISGMRSRVERVGGWLRVGPAAAGGFEVVAELPA